MDNKYTEFIENYLINDKTKSAIMLIGGWGTGKSYYIQNVLKPCLEEKKKDCIIVSLYGLNDLKDISKAIYLEEKSKKIREKISESKVLGKAEAQASARLVGKTIVKGVTSFFNIDLTSNEEDLQRLYESLDLSGKLIILEDLERTNIPIKNVLGYVNNLGEQDGVKVLLVANEKEILKSEQVVVGQDKDENDIKEWRWTAETQEYLKTKEKTISDTIPYVCDLLETIENIINQFEDENIKNLLVDKLNLVKSKEGDSLAPNGQETKMAQQLLYFEIIAIAHEICDLNLRSFIFACQKTSDLLRIYNKKIDKTFVKYLFMSIVAFSFRLKTNDKLYWDSEQNGRLLGTSKYPLHKFAHDYIKCQNLDCEEIEKEENTFLEQKKLDAIQSDVQPWLNVLYEFNTTTSTLLEMAIIEIKSHLEHSEAIKTNSYGRLANYLIIVRELIENPTLIDECKEIMLKNLQSGSDIGNTISEHLSFYDRFSFWNEEQANEYRSFILKMESIIEKKRRAETNFDYMVENVDTFIQDIIDNRDHYINQHTFLKRFDIDKLVDVIKQCTSKQINELRRAIGTIYSFSNIDEFFMDDKPSLIKLKNGIETLLLNKENVGDKIKQLQLTSLVSNLDNILKKLD